VLLVVVLGDVEGLRRLDRGRDRAAVPLRDVELRLGSFRGLALVLVMEEDHGAVLIAEVPTLAVAVGRVWLVPERFEQLLVADPIRVVGHLDHLGVSGPVRADVLVGRVFERPTLVADPGRGDALELSERRLDAPEAARSEGRLPLHYSSSSFSAA